MDKRRFVTGLVVGISFALVGGSVEAKDKQFRTAYAGSVINKDDFSFTGAPSSYATVVGKSPLGEYTAQLVVEVAPDGSTCTPPGGGSGVGLTVVGEEVVVSFAEKGDQVILHLNSDTPNLGCFDPTARLFAGQTTLDVNGGTGRFAGATGSIVKTFQTIGQAPLNVPPGKGGFSSFTGTFNGTINFAP